MPATAEGFFPFQDSFPRVEDRETLEKAFPDASKQVDRFVCVTRSDRPEDQEGYNRGLKAMFRKPGEGFYFLNLDQSLSKAETASATWPSMPHTTEEAHGFLLAEEMFDAVEAIKFPDDGDANYWCDNNIS